eukprot:163931-Amphidinium_carterae.1
MELICGVSILCGGCEEERIQAIFAVFDENGDKYISMDEMFKFLASVFQAPPKGKPLQPHLPEDVEIESFTSMPRACVFQNSKA